MDIGPIKLHLRPTCKDTSNYVEKGMKISHSNQTIVPSIYIMIELCFFSLDQ